MVHSWAYLGLFCSEGLLHPLGDLIHLGLGVQCPRSRPRSSCCATPPHPQSPPEGRTMTLQNKFSQFIYIFEACCELNVQHGNVGYWVGCWRFCTPFCKTNSVWVPEKIGDKFHDTVPSRRQKYNTIALKHSTVSFIISIILLARYCNQLV